MMFATPSLNSGSAAASEAPEGDPADDPGCPDLLTISVRAGLGFDGALGKVVEKLKAPHRGSGGPGRDPGRQGRRDACGHRPRTEVGPHQLIGAIIQAEQLGVSISKVLQVQSEQLRIERRQRRGDGGQAPIKMLFPLVGCIFPSLFIVILAAIILMQPKTRAPSVATNAATGARQCRAIDAARRAAETAGSLWGKFKGLMGRRDLPPGDGLWLPASNGIHMMFMRFPIDAVFVTKADPAGVRRVRSVHPSLAAWTGLVPLIRGADGVLELPVGTIAASGTVVGDRVEIVEGS
jgi:uncharacterized membrane protein (UPF0127 family)